MAKIVTQSSKFRGGKFKKILCSPEELLIEGPRLHENLKALHSALETGSVSPALYTALWVIQALRTRHPHGWWGAHRRDPVAPNVWPISWDELPYFDWSDEEKKLLTRYPTLGELLNHRAFLATPEAVHRALLNWEAGTYPLVFMERIPSVKEVLSQQVQGKRCVTVFYQARELSKLVLGERDPLGFTFHDLIHADHFFHQNDLRVGQIGFYRQVKSIFDAGLLDDWMKLEDFPHRLEYLMADMNSHPLHLWKCFKAILHMTRPEASREMFEVTLPGFFKLQSDLEASLKLMNGEDFEISRHGVIVSDFCQSWGEV